MQWLRIFKHDSNMINNPFTLSAIHACFYAAHTVERVKRLNYVLAHPTYINICCFHCTIVREKQQIFSLGKSNLLMIIVLSALKIIKHHHKDCSKDIAQKGHRCIMLDVVSKSTCRPENRNLL